MSSFSFPLSHLLHHHYLHHHCFLPLLAFLLMILFSYLTCPYSHLSSNGSYYSPLFALIFIIVFSQAVLLPPPSSFLARSPYLLPSLLRSIPFRLIFPSYRISSSFIEVSLNLSLSHFLLHSPSSPFPSSLPLPPLPCPHCE